MIFIFIFFPKKNQLQNNVYEIVSDINARQTLIDAKVLTLEERLLIIYEQIEQLRENYRQCQLQTMDEWALNLEKYVSIINKQNICQSLKMNILFFEQNKTKSILKRKIFAAS